MCPCKHRNCTSTRTHAHLPARAPAHSHTHADVTPRHARSPHAHRHTHPHTHGEPGHKGVTQGRREKKRRQEKRGEEKTRDEKKEEMGGGGEGGAGGEEKRRKKEGGYLGSKAPLLHDTGAEVLDQDINVVGQAAHQVAARLLVQVDGDAAPVPSLPLTPRLSGWSLGARIISLWERGGRGGKETRREQARREGATGQR